MTVVFAVRCADGLVLASDTQITQSDRGVSFPAAKLHALGDRAAWGGSGARAVLEDVEKAFDAGAAEILAAEDVSREIRTRVRPIFEHHYENFIPDVPAHDNPDATPAAYVLVAGYVRDEPFIVEVTPNVIVGRYDDIGFHAIGGGSPLAQQAGAMLAHFRMLERSVDHGVVVAVRVLDTLSSTAPNVGEPFQVYRLHRDGSTLLTDGDIDQAREHVARWIELEKEALDRLFT
ncbi:MAG: proteasome protein [Actinobacteria bacterium]|nr:proteasome protein [Actinomycetota bacterium]